MEIKKLVSWYQHPKLLFENTFPFLTYYLPCIGVSKFSCSPTILCLKRLLLPVLRSGGWFICIGLLDVVLTDLLCLKWQVSAVLRSGGIVWGAALSGMNLVTCESPRYNFEPSRRTMIAFDWFQLLPLYQIYHHHLLYHPHRLHQYHHYHHYPGTMTDSGLCQHAIFQKNRAVANILQLFLFREVLKNLDVQKYCFLIWTVLLTSPNST